MKKYLYRDFFDALFHIIVLFLPFVVGILTELNKVGRTPFVVSMIISILCSYSSIQDVYHDSSYRNEKRIRVEMIISAIILTVSLFWDFLILYKLLDGQIQVPDYTKPAIVYGCSLLPFFVELVLVTLDDLGVVSILRKRSLKKKNELIFDFDVTAGNVN